MPLCQKPLGQLVVVGLTACFSARSVTVPLPKVTMSGSVWAQVRRPPGSWVRVAQLVLLDASVNSSPNELETELDCEDALTTLAAPDPGAATARRVSGVPDEPAGSEKVATPAELCFAVVTFV